MKTKTNRKLSLSRETLRRLDADALGHAAGGRLSPNITVTCPSVDICPSLDDVAWKCKPPIQA
jgi:hypothetical protein